MAERAVFTRGYQRLADAAENLVLDVVLVGLPVPRRRRPAEDTGTELPPRFVLELTPEAVRVLEPEDDRLVESWPRRHVDADIHSLDDHEIELELYWPGGLRTGRIRAPATPAARAVGEALARDTRLAHGGSAEAEERLERLVADTLPSKLAAEHHAAIAGLALRLRAGEGPLAVAGAMHAWSGGAVLLTDMAVHWCSDGRKEPLLLPREAIRRCRLAPNVNELELELATGERRRLGLVEPRSTAELIAAALTPSLDPLDALLSEADEKDSHELRATLDRVRMLLRPDERPLVLAAASHGIRTGALVLTDRRLLWVRKKGDPLLYERGSMDAARVRKSIGGAELELEFAGGGKEQFYGIRSRERADRIAAAVVRVSR